MVLYTRGTVFRVTYIIHNNHKKSRPPHKQPTPSNHGSQNLPPPQQGRPTKLATQTSRTTADHPIEESLRVSRHGSKGFWRSLIFSLPTARATDSLRIQHGGIHPTPPPKTFAHIRRSSDTSAIALASDSTKSSCAKWVSAQRGEFVTLLFFHFFSNRVFQLIFLPLTSV